MWLDFILLFVWWCWQAKAEEEEVDRTPWGELEPSDEESSEEEEEEESDEDKPDETGFFTPADRCRFISMIQTVSSTDSLACV